MPKTEVRHIISHILKLFTTLKAIWPNNFFSKKNPKNFLIPIQPRAELNYLSDWHLTRLSVLSKFKNFKILGKEKFHEENPIKFIHPDSMYLATSKKHLKIMHKIFSERLRKLISSSDNSMRLMPSIPELLIFSELLALNTIDFDMREYGVILDFILRLKDEFEAIREVFDEEIGTWCRQNGYDYWLDMEVGQTQNRPNL